MKFEFDTSDMRLRGQTWSGRVTITMGRRSATVWYEQTADYTGELSDIESDSALFLAYVEARRSAIEEDLTDRLTAEMERAA